MDTLTVRGWTITGLDLTPNRRMIALRLEGGARPVARLYSVPPAVKLKGLRVGDTVDIVLQTDTENGHRQSLVSVRPDRRTTQESSAAVRPAGVVRA